MKKFKIKKGRHYSTPLLVNATRYLSSTKTKDVQSYVFMLDDSCEYCKNNELGGDCKDWNKLLGMSFSPRWNARKNSVMLAWRHTSGGGLEVQPYLHNSEGKAIYKDFRPLQIKKDIYYLVKILTHRIVVQELLSWASVNRRTGELSSYPSIENINGDRIDWNINNLEVKESKRFRQINTWFGGNRKAPQNITIQLDRRF